MNKIIYTQIATIKEDDAGALERPISTPIFHFQHKSCNIPLRIVELFFEKINSWDCLIVCSTACHKRPLLKPGAMRSSCHCPKLTYPSLYP